MAPTDPPQLPPHLTPRTLGGQTVWVSEDGAWVVVPRDLLATLDPALGDGHHADPEDEADDSGEPALSAEDLPTDDAPIPELSTGADGGGAHGDDASGTGAPAGADPSDAADPTVRRTVPPRRSPPPRRPRRLTSARRQHASTVDIALDELPSPPQPHDRAPRLADAPAPAPDGTGPATPSAPPASPAPAPSAGTDRPSAYGAASHDGDDADEVPAARPMPFGEADEAPTVVMPRAIPPDLASRPAEASPPGPGAASDPSGEAPASAGPSATSRDGARPLAERTPGPLPGPGAPGGPRDGDGRDDPPTLAEHTHAGDRPPPSIPADAGRNAPRAPSPPGPPTRASLLRDIDPSADHPDDTSAPPSLSRTAADALGHGAATAAGPDGHAPPPDGAPTAEVVPPPAALDPHGSSLQRIAMAFIGLSILVIALAAGVWIGTNLQTGAWRSPQAPAAATTSTPQPAPAPPPTGAAAPETPAPGPDAAPPANDGPDAAKSPGTQTPDPSDGAEPSPTPAPDPAAVAGAAADPSPEPSGADDEAGADEDPDPAPAPAPPPSPDRRAKTAAAAGWSQVESDPSGAILRFETALALDPDLTDAHYGLGYALIKLGRPASAEPHLCRARLSAPITTQREIRGLLREHDLSCR